MRRAPLRLVAALLALGAAPALAWEVEQGGGTAVVRHAGGGLAIEMACARGGRPNALDLRIAGLPVEGTRGVLLWLAQPDGRQAKHSVDLAPAGGGAMAGTFLVSPVVLDQFRQGVELRVAVNGDEPTFVTDLRGSGAARLAILEQCGF